MFPEPVPRHAVPGKREPVVRSCSLFDGVGEEWSFNILLNSIDEWEGSLDPRMTSPASADPFEWGPRWIWTDDMDLAFVFFFFGYEACDSQQGGEVGSSRRLGLSLVGGRSSHASGDSVAPHDQGDSQTDGTAQLSFAPRLPRCAWSSRIGCALRKEEVKLPVSSRCCCKSLCLVGGEATSTRSKMTLPTSRRANGNPPFQFPRSATSWDVGFTFVSPCEAAASVVPRPTMHNLIWSIWMLASLVGMGCQRRSVPTEKKSICCMYCTLYM